MKAATTRKSVGGAKRAARPPAKPKAGAKKKVVLLAGGNPQIAKADGDAPVQEYIAAAVGWKSAVCKTLDEVMSQAVPSVRKAVKWNSPFYGASDGTWFASVHILTRYVKITFFAGTSLRPLPPGGTEKSKEARWLDIFETDKIDLEQLRAWCQQAARLPGWKP